MALLYEPEKKTATIQYVYYRSIEKNATGFQRELFNAITGDLEGLFSKYYTNLFRQTFK